MLDNRRFSKKIVGVITGPSGSGKSTLSMKLKEEEIFFLVNTDDILLSLYSELLTKIAREENERLKLGLSESTFSFDEFSTSSEMIRSYEEKFSKVFSSEVLEIIKSKFDKNLAKVEKSKNKERRKLIMKIFEQNERGKQVIPLVESVRGDDLQKEDFEEEYEFRRIVIYTPLPELFERCKKRNSVSTKLGEKRTLIHSLSTFSFVFSLVEMDKSDEVLIGRIRFEDLKESFTLVRNFEYDEETKNAFYLPRSLFTTEGVENWIRRSKTMLYLKHKPRGRKWKDYELEAKEWFSSLESRGVKELGIVVKEDIRCDLIVYSKEIEEAVKKISAFFNFSAGK